MLAISGRYTENSGGSRFGADSHPELTKRALKALKLSRDDIQGAGAGVEVARTLLSNLASVARYMNELRNLTRTGLSVGLEDEVGEGDRRRGRKAGVARAEPPVPAVAAVACAVQRDGATSAPRR